MAARDEGSARMRATTPHMLAGKGGQWEDYRRLCSKEKFLLGCHDINSNQSLGKYMQHALKEVVGGDGHNPKESA
jgi:hypothetical protein